MAQIETSLDLTSTKLVLTFPSLEPLHVPLDVQDSQQDLLEKELCSGEFMSFPF